MIDTLRRESRRRLCVEAVQMLRILRRYGMVGVKSCGWAEVLGSTGACWNLIAATCVLPVARSCHGCGIDGAVRLGPCSWPGRHLADLLVQPLSRSRSRYPAALECGRSDSTLAF